MPIKKKIFLSLFIYLFIGTLLSACSDDDQGKTMAEKPQVTFDNGTGVYQVKYGERITISPMVQNAIMALYRWEQNGEIIGIDKELIFEGKKMGSNYLSFIVDAKNGTVREDVRIDVLEKLPPEISLPIPEGGLIAYAGRDFPLAATVKNYTKAIYEWQINSDIVSTDSLYLFNRTETGEYALSLTVTNEDGSDRVTTLIQVEPLPPFSVEIETASLSVPLGRTCHLKALPTFTNSTSIHHQWSINGTPQLGITGDCLELTPAQVGETYEINVTANDGIAEATAAITITCIAPEGTYYRAATHSSSPFANRVYRYLPAPGQFINACKAGTQAEANLWAEAKLNTREMISLGGFGGSIVVGFDHSIDNKPNGYDFGIEGNSFDNSSEPGIVWVMQDENGDGLPNDTWYELKGSEFGKPETKQNYSLSYFKPKTTGMPVVWKDATGKSGSLTLTPYYPTWVTAGSYTLSGVLLQSKVTQDPSTGLWETGNYDWGYVDNFGSDRQSGEANSEGDPNFNYFKIENAVTATGQSVKLSYIDFVQVQVGVHVQAGWLGELSTEVVSFKDYKANE